MNLKIERVIFLCLFFISSAALAKDYNIMDFGALSDTARISTSAIQKAIDKCSAEEGGKVIIPRGNFVTGTLILKSNVHLFLEEGAILYGSKNIKDYPDIRTNFVSFRTGGQMSQLLYAENAHNISIFGFGTIDGRGEGFPHIQGAIDEGITRPHVLQFIACKKVLIEGITMRNSACWMQHYLACEELTIKNINVFNHCNYNNDAIDVDGCKNVVISDVTIDSDDDGITFKSTSDYLCENIVVSNCIVSSHCNAIKMGTETNGGFKNIDISNCIIKPSAVNDKVFFGKVDGNGGIALEIVDGGIMKGITISNITIEGTVTPIFVRLGNRARPYKPNQGTIGVGSISDVFISNIHARGSKGIGCSITGIPGYPVENVRLRNIFIEQTGGEKKDIVYAMIPEKETTYPEGYMFGTLPAYGFYIRHAKNITLDSMDFRYQKPDARPAVFLDDTDGVTISNSRMQCVANSEGNVVIKQSKNVYLNGNSLNGFSPVFVKVLDDTTSTICVQNNFINEETELRQNLKKAELIVPKLSFSDSQPSFTQIKKAFEREHIPFQPIGYVWKNYPNKVDARFRMAYSNNELYLQFTIKENSLRAVIDNDDTGMPSNDSCVEFFLIPGDDQKYYNFEFNCIGACLLEKGTGRRDRERFHRNITQLIRRESSLGTVPFTEKKGKFEWTITIAIPNSLFSEQNITSFEGKTVSANFFKCGNELTPPHWLAWSPVHTVTPAFHEPVFFGNLKFVNEEIKTER